jgi:hypothetical protein
VTENQDENVSVLIRRADVPRLRAALGKAAGDAEDDETAEALDDIDRALGVANRRGAAQ